MECKIDRNGFKFYDKLPGGYRVAKMDDFHNNGRKRVGMEYLIHTFYSRVYEIHQVMDFTSAVDLKTWIEAGRIYVKN